MATADRISIRPSVVADVYEMAARLRDADRAEIQAMGAEPRFALRRNYRSAILRRTYFVDGRIAAMSGLCGEMMGDIGQPYLVTTKTVEEIPPLSFIRVAREAVSEMLAHKLRLEGVVAAEYRRACKMLQMIGFDLGEAKPFGATGSLFRTFIMVR